MTEDNQKSIMIIGSSNFDINLKVEEIPEVGETILSDYMETGFGGKGANQAFTVQKIGGKVDYLTCIGDDVFGQLYFEVFKQNNFDLRFIKVIKSQQNGIAIVNINREGNNSIVVFPGSSSSLKTEIILDNLDIILEHEIIMTQLEIPVETVEFLSKKLKDKHIFILNPSPVNSRYDYSTILKRVDILIPNEIELSQLSGIKIKNNDDIKKASYSVIEKGVESVIVTIGSKGAMVISQDIESYIEPTAHRAVDSSGAGDAFAGAFMYMYSITGDLIKSAGFANKVAGVSVTRYGTHKSVPTREEINSMPELFKDYF
jgi:ribokinase